MFESGILSQGLLGDCAALAAVAVIAYIFGRRPRPRCQPTGADEKLLDELGRAQRIADELSRAIGSLDVPLSSHRRSVAAFQSQLSAMQTGSADADWAKLRSTAERLLAPTLKLSTNLYVACEQLRRQLAELSAFSGTRTDPATGLQNRRALEEQLDASFSIHALGKQPFALAIFSVGSPGDVEPSQGESRLRQIARLLELCIRDRDLVARYSHDEFVVLMPQTTLAGAVAFSERLLTSATHDLECNVCGGVVEAAGSETPQKLLSRADSALYSARAAGGSSLFLHNGVGVRRHVVEIGATDEIAADVEPLAAMS